MRLKTKLVLAITALVLLISGLLSLVYVTQFLYASVKASYNTNKMVANQVKLAVQNALETGLRDRTFDPNKPYELREMAADAIRKSEALQVVIDSVNRYSDTVYDINIDDTSGRVLLSTLPENEDKTLPTRPDNSELSNANPIRLISAVLLEQFKVFDVGVTLERNNQPFVYIHVGVSTAFLREAYKPWLGDAFELMCIALGIALVVALLLSNLALRPLEEISMQLDYWTAAGESAEEDKARTRQDTAARVSTKI